MTILERFQTLGIEASPERAALFERFADLFIEYNSHTNLSAIRDRDGIVEKHFADSLFLMNFADISGKRVLDIGTGGGFPGIPLKIMIPSAEFLLLDSVSKKTKACDHFIAELGLAGISTAWSRAEDLTKRPGMKAWFDAVVSRATAYMPEILSWAVPFLKKGGSAYLYKTPSDTEKVEGLAAAARLGLHLKSEYQYDFQGTNRSIFEFVFRNQ